MKNLWLKIGCMLTGYQYLIVKNASEASSKTVKKYVSALMIVSMLWGFIGFSFANRYLQTSTFVSSIVALVMILIIIQIERQIILSNGKNLLIPFFRTLIGIVMAVIGSVIIDQIIFKDDIERGKISHIQETVNNILHEKTRQLDNQIRQIDSILLFKENERIQIINEITKNPVIKSGSNNTTITTIPVIVNGVKRDSLIKHTEFTIKDVENPKVRLIPNLETQVTSLRAERTEIENRRINARQQLEAELESKTGFLDELQVLISILRSFRVALFVWLMFFIFFMSLELLVLVNKFGEKSNDYDMIVDFQEQARKDRITQLSIKQIV